MVFFKSGSPQVSATVDPILSPFNSKESSLRTPISAEAESDHSLSMRFEAIALTLNE